MAAKTQAVARQVLEIIPLVMRTVAAELRRTGHLLDPSHYRLLAMLAHRSYNLSELAERHAVSLPTMSNSITKLVERGWVRRAPATHDRRMVLIELTPAGRAALAEVHRQAEAHVAESLASLSRADQDKLLAGLDILRHAFGPAVDSESNTPHR